MNAPEKKMQDYVAALNDMAREILGDMLADSRPGLITPKGTLVAIPPGRRGWAYYECGTHKFAWTNLPDQNGDYWAWTYKPDPGPGSRTKPRSWSAVDLVSFRHPGAAKRRAGKRYDTYRRTHSK